MERWEEEAKARQEPVAAWARRWRISPGMDEPEATEWYTGASGCVGSGWIPILERLAADLVALGWDRYLDQVKEKFGGLRFYVGASTEAMQQRIAEAEAESLRTCEDCGAPGRRRTNDSGYVRTTCELCAARARRRKR